MYFERKDFVLQIPTQGRGLSTAEPSADLAMLLPACRRPGAHCKQQQPVVGQANPRGSQSSAEQWALLSQLTDTETEAFRNTGENNFHILQLKDSIAQQQNPFITHCQKRGSAFLIKVFILLKHKHLITEQLQNSTLRRNLDKIQFYSSEIKRGHNWLISYFLFLVGNCKQFAQE